MSFSPWIRHLGCALGAVVLTVGCGSGRGAGAERLWVADDYVQCNAFDEPYRECLLVSHVEFGLYRHLEGGIEGFDFSPGTRYLLEVEAIPGSDPTSWRLIDVVSAE